MRVLILNVHSGLNLGDDAIMYETLRGIRQSMPEASIRVAANDPRSWRHYQDVAVVPSLTAWVVDRRRGWRWRKWAVVGYACFLACAVLAYRVFGRRLLIGSPAQRQLLAAYYDADLVLSCGGGNFYAQRTVDIALLWSIVTLGLAHALGKRVVMLPQSIGPVDGRLQRVLLRRMLRGCEHVLLREERSLALVQALGAERRAVVLPDLAFGLDPVAGQDRQSEPPGSQARLQIGVTLMDRAAQEPRFRHQQRYEDALTRLLVRLSDEQQAQIHIFVQCYGPTPDQDDRLIAQRIYARLKQHTAHVVLRDTFGDALTLQAAYAEMDCVIGTRMHTGILALCSNVPVLLIAYQPKAFGMMRQLGLDRFCCAIDDVDDGVLRDMVDALIAERQALRHLIAQRMAALRTQHAAWKAYLLD